ncbi:hypothetical protein [Polyangium sp. 6x1]|uniref:hypothetical protein n=1 Tax=Polyangium sp. 6x1 TaxID=3042689 RepID=UPI002482AB5A|nr:hypothetical protein [Polyangium sp. 6x1]MDI1442905.1 hypothetical protein [Polyangium sp. 6x1]
MVPMRAHRQRVQVSGDHRVTVDLPEDFPEGPAEVVIHVYALETTTSAKETSVHDEFARLFAPDPLLSRVVFHEDAAAPLSPEDWPEESA